LNVEHLNPFVASAVHVLEAQGLGVEREALRLHSSPVAGHEINVMVGITGEVQGQVILGMERDTALLIARRMIPFEVTDFDELAQSAVQELTNILGGNASANFERLGIQTNLSVPSMLIGKDIVISTGNRSCLVVPLRILSPQGPQGLVDMMIILANS
jgi:chemotaxis protein CheX